MCGRWPPARSAAGRRCPARHPTPPIRSRCAWRMAASCSFIVPVDIWPHGPNASAKAFADQHALILDSGEEFAGPERIVIGRDDVPYLRISQGVSDWVRDLKIVPYRSRFASPAGRRWQIHVRKAPPEDPDASYVWLGHIEAGYAARPGGPARSQEPRSRAGMSRSQGMNPVIRHFISVSREMGSTDLPTVPSGVRWV